MKWTTPEGLNLPVPLWKHHLALCGEYLYLVGGTAVYPWHSPEDDNTQAWRAKWSDVKQTAAPQHSQPQRGVWTQIANPPTLRPTPVSCGGTLYTVGGETRDKKPISTVYTYITARDQWVSVGDMSVGRVYHCAVPLSSSTIFVAGGRVKNKGKYVYSPLTELLLLQQHDLGLHGTSLSMPTSNQFVFVVHFYNFHFCVYELSVVQSQHYCMYLVTPFYMYKYFDL